MLNNADGKSEEMVNRAHPLGVSFGKVIVDCNKMDPPAFKGVQVDRQCGNEGLALACLHFRNPALVKRNAADDLDVKMSHVQDTL